MDSLETSLLWLGVEDYTGLWQAVAEARDDTGSLSLNEAQVKARRSMESLLRRGYVEMFACQEPLNNESVDVVPPERWPIVLAEVASWEPPEEGAISFRYATTDQGFVAYRKEVSWNAK